MSWGTSSMVCRRRRHGPRSDYQSRQRRRSFRQSASSSALPAAKPRLGYPCSDPMLDLYHLPMGAGHSPRAFSQANDLTVFAARHRFTLVGCNYLIIDRPLQVKCRIENRGAIAPLLSGQRAVSTNVSAFHAQVAVPLSPVIASLCPSASPKRRIDQELAQPKHSTCTMHLGKDSAMHGVEVP